MSARKCNFHTHSNFCDVKNTAEEMVLAAIEKGFDNLGFSSHCMHPLNPEFYTPFDHLWHIAADNIKAYTEEIHRLKKKYADKINIYLGFEADYFSSPEYGTAFPSKATYEEFSPDYLIGAVHFINTDKGFYTVDHKVEIVKENLIRLYSKANGEIDGRAAVCDYFAAEREMLKKGDFDIIAHCDLIKLRNGPLNFFNPEESWYKDEIKATALEIAKSGVIAEINTGAIGRGIMDDTYPSQYFLELLYELGVPVCINSDAHTTAMLDAAFDRAAAQAKKTGYTELVYPGNNIVQL
jgi:histidinol-phosphatase (PHP family)